MSVAIMLTVVATAIVQSVFGAGVLLFGTPLLQGVAGFGPDGVMRTASLVDLSLDLPLVVEFYGEPSQMESVIDKLI